MAYNIENHETEAAYQATWTTQKNMSVGGTLAVTGNSTLSTLTVTSTFNVTGVTTLTGGTAPASNPQTVFSVGGGVVTAASGAINQFVASQVNWSAIYFPFNMTITGLGFLS